MCGIAAALDRTGYGIDRDALLRMRERLAPRGPDGEGLWVSGDARVGLAHRRLSVIDPSEAGAQPMASADGRLVVTFNGEVYNHRALRADLERRGFTFRSHSDTEVVLHLYREHGADLVHHLRGMFAFALWDGEREGLLLARDPYGIKPLYYAEDGRSLHAASTVKALLAGGSVDTAPDPAGHVGFFLWGHVPEPHTLYRGLRALPAGHTAWAAASRLDVRAYASIPAALAEAEAMARPAPDARCDLAAALRDSVKAHLVADVPVGAFLSAGLDSSTLTALAAEEGGRLRTVTLGFEEYRGTPTDEVPLAEAVSRHYSTDHQTAWVTRADFAAAREHVLDQMDQPTLDGVNTYFVARAAAEAGLKVALSGVGGDELFGGYPSFREIPRLVAATGRVPAGVLGRGLRVLTAPALARLTSPKYAGLLEYGGDYAGAYLLRRGLFMPWELPGLLDPDLVREGWNALAPRARLAESAAPLRTPALRVTALESCWYLRNQLLRDTDWASMAHGLEVRTPLVDWTLLRAIAPLRAADPRLGKQAMARTPTRPLPPALLDRPKTGFTIPIRDWLLAGAAGREADRPAERGLRSWARFVYEAYGEELFSGRPGAPARVRSTVLRPGNGNAPSPSTGRAPRGGGEAGYGGRARGTRILALLTDAYGGRGGIAQHNRHLLEALCAAPGVEGVVAVPRVVVEDAGPLPERLTYCTDAAEGKAAYLRTLSSFVSGPSAFDVVVCGHLNLLPLAAPMAWRHGARLIQVVHGIEAWAPRGWAHRRSLRGVDDVVSVSRFTLGKFLAWAGPIPSRTHVVPNAVNLSAFTPGPRPPELVRRYGLEGKTVLLTVARMAGFERYKGFDEILEVLPALAEAVPSLVYLAVGDGDDRARLEAKARALGVADRVVFTGYVPEEEKADHYRLADVFAMPGRGEGFGIVYLEALACGIPVVASSADASREAVLDGRLGAVVDPADPAALHRAIVGALRHPMRPDPAALATFGAAAFHARWHAVLTGEGVTVEPLARSTSSVRRSAPQHA